MSFYLIERTLWIQLPYNAHLASLSQHFANHLLIFSMMIEEQEMLRLLVLNFSGHLHLLHGVRVVAQIVHGGGIGHGRGRKVLHLIGLQSVLFSFYRQMAHVGERASWVRRDEIGYQLLVLARLTVHLVKFP